MKKALVLTSMGVMIMASAVAATHTVRSGDTMFNIAQAHNLTLAQIGEMNPQIRDINRIYVGQEVNVRAQRAAAPAPAPVAQVREHTPAPVREVARTHVPCTAGECHNVLDGNPLFRPAAGMFVSTTTFGFDVDNRLRSGVREFGATTELAYGITNNLSIALHTGGLTSDRFQSGTYSWNNFGGSASFRFFQDGGWRADAFGGLTASEHNWWKEASNIYVWNAGVRAGYTTCAWTLAAFVEGRYANAGAFDWNVPGMHMLSTGVEGQYVLNHRWNLVANASYNMIDGMSALNHFVGTFGVNFNIDPKMYVGVGLTQTLNRDAKFMNDATGVALTFGAAF